MLEDQGEDGVGSGEMGAGWWDEGDEEVEEVEDVMWVVASRKGCLNRR